MLRIVCAPNGVFHTSGDPFQGATGAHAAPACFRLVNKLTPSDRVLDLGLVVACREGREFFGGYFGGGGWVAAEDDLDGAEHPTVVKACTRGRQFPMFPPVFNGNLDKCTFTNGSVLPASCQCQDLCITLVCH